jgi:hypothetical protein
MVLTCAKFRGAYPTVGGVLEAEALLADGVGEELFAAALLDGDAEGIDDDIGDGDADAFDSDLFLFSDKYNVQCGFVHSSPYAEFFTASVPPTLAPTIPPLTTTIATTRRTQKIRRRSPSILLWSLVSYSV